MKFYTFFSILILFPILLFAQNDNSSKGIRGAVFDATGQPLDLVTITIFKGNDSTLLKSVFSDQSGHFNFENVLFGKYTIIASLIGYETERIDIDETEDQQKEIEIKMLKSSTQLSEVVITGQKSLLEYKTDKIVMNVENSILASGNNMFELLQKAPGVTIEGEQINLRGRANVAILIDGKPTYLSADQMNNLLRTTQSSAIGTIEIITNPSAKFDAAGSSGIINIVTKRNKLYGTTGAVSLNGGYGRYYKWDGNFSLYHHTQKINFFANYSIGKRLDFNDIYINRSVSLPQSRIFETNSFSKFPVKSQNFKTGLDYYINEKNTIGIVVNGNFNNQDATRSGTTTIGSGDKLDSAIIATNDGNSYYEYLNFNLNHQSILNDKGYEIQTSFDYSTAKRRDFQYITNQNLDSSFNSIGPQDVFTNTFPNNVKVFVGRTDFILPFNESSKLEAGLKYSSVNTDNDVLFQNKDSDGDFVDDPSRSNRFIYDENISSAYVSLNKEFDRLSFQAGIRLERTSSRGNSITNETIVNKTYLNFFPTLFLKYHLSDNNELGFSFGRRIDRPDYGSLNPFVYFVDQYTYNVGNPYLNPQYTNAFEINFLFERKYALSFGMNRTSDALSNVFLNNPETNAIYKTKLNLSNLYNYNMNISVPTSFTRWWNSYNNILFYYNKVSADDLNGERFEQSKGSFQINSNHVFTIKPIRIEISGNYFSPALSGTFIRKSFYGVDFGVASSVFKKQLDVKFALSDIFSTRDRMYNYSEVPNNQYNMYTGFESRIARISLAYHFGKNTVKKVDKSGGAEEERNRIKY